MAPTPDDDFGNHKQQTDAPNIPCLFTSTYTPDPQHTVTVAYLVNSYIGDYGHVVTYTITSFTNLAQASAVATKIQAAEQSYQDGTFPTDPAAYSSLINGYQNYPTSAQADNLYSSAAMTGGSSSATGNPTNSPQQQENQKHHGPPVGVLAAGIIIPILVCLITITVCIFCVSHYRKKARSAGSDRTSSEMLEVGRNGPKPTTNGGASESRAYLAPTRDIPMPTTALSPAPLAAGAIGQEPPVILSTTMNTYYTGIDTSDHVSISDQRSVASLDTFGEEPPPPYRPRSVPPISRETSVRTSITSTPNRNSSTRSRCETLSSGSIIRRSNEVRSPFDDPEEEEEDDDDSSEVSTIRGSASRREADRLSVVSDLSYQDEPTSLHSHV